MTVRVSAIISTHAAEPFIEGCLQDLIEQSLFTKGLLEIVVVDSASPQDEGRVVERFQQRYPRIHYHRTIERETLYGAWNTGIARSSGEYITNANTDDRHRADGLERLLEVIEQHPKVDLVYADVMRSKIANERFDRNDASAVFYYKNFFAPEVLLHYQFGCQPMWRRSVHDRIGPFDANYWAAGDYEFNFRFAMAGLTALHVDTPLGSFLERKEALSTQDHRSVDEQATLRKRYCTTANAVHLYGCAGWDVTSSTGKVHALNDLACRSAGFSLPWHPGESFIDAGIAVECLLEALKLSSHNTGLLNNLAVILARLGRAGDALNLFSQITNIPIGGTVEENIQIISGKATHAGKAPQLLRELA